MATKRTTTKRVELQRMSEAVVEDIVKKIVRDAVSQQAREVETHLNHIDSRLAKLESK